MTTIPQLEPFRPLSQTQAHAGQPPATTATWVGRIIESTPPAKSVSAFLSDQLYKISYFLRTAGSRLRLCKAPSKEIAFARKLLKQLDNDIAAPHLSSDEISQAWRFGAQTLEHAIYMKYRCQFIQLGRRVEFDRFCEQLDGQVLDFISTRGLREKHGLGALVHVMSKTCAELDTALASRLVLEKRIA